VLSNSSSRDTRRSALEFEEAAVLNFSIASRGLKRFAAQARGFFPGLNTARNAAEAHAESGERAA